MSNSKGVYSPVTTVKKGVISGLLSLVPAVFGAIAAAVAAPNVAVALGHQWPTLPVAAIIGAVVGLNNWVKNRAK